MSRISTFIGVVLGCVVIGGAASAQTFTAYDLAAPAAGNQQWGSTLGLSFTVNSAISVSSLGAFDAADANGAAHTLNGTIITSIYDSSTQQIVPGLTTSFSAASPGTLTGGYLYKPVGGLNGVLLAPGSYVIAWTSINNNDLEGNSTLPGFTVPTTNEGGNLITINKSQFRYNELVAPYLGADKYPINTIGGQLDAGTFKYSAVTPEPGAVSLFGGLVAVGGSTLLRRRRLRKNIA